MYISDISKSGRYSFNRSAAVKTHEMTVPGTVSDTSWAEDKATSSGKHQAIKTARNYAVMAAACLVIGIVYELFSHDVFSIFMVGAFAVPLILGALPNLVIGLKGLKTPGCTAENVYACGIITLTIGSMLKGVLEIFGTTNSLLKYYFIAGAAFIILGSALYLAQKKA